MSVGRFLQQAAAGNAGAGPTYVDDVFSTYLYTGIQPTENSIDNGIDLDGKGGLVWIKKRSDTGQHELFDTERGATKTLRSNLTNAELTRVESLKSFNSNGFTVGNDTVVNNAGTDFVSWTFRKQPGFFDVVTYTGDGVAGRTVSHNLGSVPGMIIVKSTSNATNWAVYHRGMDSSNPENYSMYLNVSDGRAYPTSDLFDSTAPTDTEFTIGLDSDVNASGYEYVAYLFAHDAQEFGTDSDESIIKCGSYVGNGTSSSSTQHIDLGFEPQFFLVKVSYNSIGGPVSGQEWFLVDTMRGFVNNGNNFDDQRLMPSTNDDEAGYPVGHPTATGIQLKGNENEINFNGHTYIYMAIRRPHKPASEFAATDLFAIDTKGGTSPTPPAYVSGFPVDMALHKNVSANGDWRAQTRLTQGKYLETNNTGAEVTDANMAAFDFQNGYRNATGTTSSSYAWMFRRAPGFFDVVVYAGSSSAQEISHNLGVAPELIIQKCRTQGSYPWNSWYTGLTNSQYINFNDSPGVQTSSNLWGTNATVATDSVFRTGSGNTGVDGSTSDTHIVYLFASVDGISKVGTFNRPSQVAQDIDCGFENGARFVLIKRTNTTGNWVLWDSARGIVAGNEPYLLTNTASAQVTSQDYIDPLSSGFTLTSGIATGDWVFLAIA